MTHIFLYINLDIYFIKITFLLSSTSLRIGAMRTQCLALSDMRHHPLQDRFQWCKRQLDFQGIGRRLQYRLRFRISIWARLCTACPVLHRRMLLYSQLIYLSSLYYSNCQDLLVSRIPPSLRWARAPNRKLGSHVDPIPSRGPSLGHQRLLSQPTSELAPRIHSSAVMPIYW